MPRGEDTSRDPRRSVHRTVPYDPWANEGRTYTESEESLENEQIEKINRVNRAVEYAYWLQQQQQRQQ